MGTFFLKILLAVFVCLEHNKVSVLALKWPSESSHVKCRERERQALLNFKQSVEDYYGMLSTWKDDENNRDCCGWEGIECNNETGHVELLDLRGSESHYLSGSFNITSLLDLQNLEYLDLSSHPDISGSQISEQMDSFKSLRYLNLSYSHFIWGIPSHLGNLSKLEYLDLKETGLYGTIPSQLGNLSRLMYLDISGNSFSGALPFQVGNLPLLHYLRLDGSSGHELKDGHWLSSLSSLTTLDLYLFFDLSFSPYWFQMIREHIPNLRELSLVDCDLSDDHISSLFPSHSNISTSLSILDLSHNMLTSSTFQLLSNYSPNLQELHLSSNNIVLSSPHFPNFPSLVILDLSENNLTIFQGNLNFSTKLQNLNLRYCSLTDESFVVSSDSIKNSHSLVTLDLSVNLLKSSAIFHWLFNFTTNLESFSLSNNLIEGVIPVEFGKAMNSLEFLDFSGNKLHGEIPAPLGSICTLKELYLRNNYLCGEISSFIQNSLKCNNPVLEVLNLSNNLIIGEIPESIGFLYQLRALHLEDNYLKGSINELHLTNLSQLRVLDLSGNLLSLMFGTSWIPPFQLVKLGLGSCKLGPSFPSWLQALSQLSFLDISDAGIDDFVPYWFWNKLHFIQELNMCCNSLKGTIPNLPIVNDGGGEIILNSNKLEGVIPAFLSHAETLDLSKNNFSDLNTLLCENRVTKYMFTLDLSNNQNSGTTA